MASPSNTIAYASWILLLMVWLPAYFTSKKGARTPVRGLQIATTGLLALSFFLLFSGNKPFLLNMRIVSPPAWLAQFGAALSVAAVLFAIWSRITLGSNWSGAFATLKHDHELVRSGPYARIRHPIYTGLWLAMFGTALTIGTLASYLAVVLASVAFLLRIRIEEALLTSQFPEIYPEYKRRTCALIPFFW